MALVVVGGALRGAGQHRQDRRGAIERLNLRFLVDAQHDRALGRVQIQAGDVADLRDELRVGGQLPCVLAVRSKAERVPDPVDRRLRQPDLRSHRPRRPVRRVLGLGLQGRGDHLLDLRIGDRPRRARSRLVDKPVQAVGDKPRAPDPDGVSMHPQLLGDLRVTQPLAGSQHDPRARCKRLRTRSPTRPRHKLLTLGLAEHDLDGNRTRHHRILLLHRN